VHSSPNIAGFSSRDRGRYVTEPAPEKMSEQIKNQCRVPGKAGGRRCHLRGTGGT
jgi:hypothetical protein